MAGGCFQKIITFSAAGLLIMLLAVNVSEAEIGTGCTNRGNEDCAAGNNEVCTTSGCACDTEFTDMAGTCDLNCTTPPNLADGTVSVSGVTATYTCTAGYMVSSPANRTCSNSTWSGSAPNCTFGCPPLSNPTDGTVAVSDVTATYTCNTGFTVTGGPTQTCGTGTWGGTAATCVLACTAQTNPSNGTVSMSANVATFTCTNGYTLSGSSTLTCNTNTTWSGSAPNCSAVLGRTCTTISNCSSVPNAVCASSSVCDCQPGYQKNGTMCDEQSALGESCTDNTNCATTNAVCMSNSCSCNEGYTQAGTLCYVKSGGGPGVSNSLVGIIITFILTALAM